jgi:hypothetical protein
MKAGLPADEPDTTPATPEQQQAAPEFQQMLSISPFVKEPQHVEAAIRAADEVWKVASGQMPASQMLEAMRAANPQGFQSVFQNLASYVEQVSGKKLGGEPAKTDDPVQQRLNAIESQFRQQEETRQNAIVQQQTDAARTVALDTVTKITKGSAFEGDETYLLARCAEKINVDQAEMVKMLNRGFTKPLESALKAVQKEETARLSRYNERLIKNYRTLKSAVPGVKGPTPSAAGTATPAYKDGETATQFATRIWNSGLV